MLVREAVVGRDAERAALHSFVDDVVRGRGGVIVVEGPAGIGKTTLADLGADAARERGVIVLRAGCRELEVGRAFGACARLLDLRHSSPDPQRAELAELLGRAGADPATSWQAVDAVCDLVEAAAIAGPSLVVVEDVHWLDVPTAVVLGRLAELAEELPLGLLLTARPHPSPSHVGALLHDLARRSATRLTLAPWGREAVAAWVRAATSVTPSERLLDLLDGAGGSPLFVTELLRSLVTEGVLAERDGHLEVHGETDLPSFALTILRRLVHLTPEAVEVLRHAAVLGDEATVSRLATFARRPEAAVTDAVEEATRAGLLLPEGGVGAVFRHTLVRQALEEDLPTTTRRYLHRRAAEVLRDEGAATATWAPHLAHGLDAGDVDVALVAASELVDVDPRQAQSLVAAVVALLGPGDDRTVQANLVLARAAARLGSPGEAEGLAVALDDAALEVGDRLELWRTVTLARHLRGDDTGESCLHYRVALDQADLEPGQRGDHLALLASVRAWADPPTARTLAEEVLALPVGPHARAVAHAALFAAGMGIGDVGLAARSADAARDVVTAHGIDDSWAGVEALASFGFLWSIEPSRFEEVTGAIQLALRRAEGLGLAHAVPRLHAELARTMWFQGLFDDAEVHAQTALRTMAEYGYGEHADSVVGMLVDIAWERGRDDEAQRLLDQVPEQAYVTRRENWFNRARVALRRGDVDEAWQLSAQGVDWLRRSDAAVVSLVWSLPYVESGVLTGHRDAAQEWVDHVARYDTTDLVTPIRAFLGIARAVLQPTTEDARAALAIARASAVYPFRLEGFRIVGQVLAAAGERDEAVEVLRDGRALAERAGAVTVVAQYDSILRGLGVRRGAVGGSRASTGWASLTEAEVRVVELVAQGLVYREVGERLFISRRTVETHVANVFRKLGLRGRNELTRAWLEREFEQVR